MSRTIWSRFTKVAVALAWCALGEPLSAQSLTVVSWGGSYARASQEAYRKMNERVIVWLSQ